MAETEKKRTKNVFRFKFDVASLAVQVSLWHKRTRMIILQKRSINLAYVDSGIFPERREFTGLRVFFSFVNLKIFPLKKWKGNEKRNLKKNVLH